VLDSATLPPEVRLAVAEVSQSPNGALRVKMHDKHGPLVSIGKHLGMFTDVVQMRAVYGVSEHPNFPLSVSRQAVPHLLVIASIRANEGTPKQGMTACSLCKRHPVDVARSRSRIDPRARSPSTSQALIPSLGARSHRGTAAIAIANSCLD
jgi:hypothetical protein